MSAELGVRPLTAVLVVLLLSGCEQKMAHDSRLHPWSRDPMNPEVSSARLPVEGTVARGHLDEDEAYYRGTLNGAPVKDIPVKVTRALLERGRERFNIYCAPCHNETGDGHGMIVQRGFLAPPTYHQDSLRQAPAGHFFDVITHGYGAMFSYAQRVDVPDRWAITAYIRALQLSQNARASDIPADERRQLEETK